MSVYYFYVLVACLVLSEKINVCDDVLWCRFRLWNVLFVLVRLGTITLSVLTLWFVPFLCACLLCCLVSMCVGLLVNRELCIWL